MRDDAKWVFARRLALSVGFGILALSFLAAGFDTFWSQGADFVRHQMPRRLPTIQQLAALWWLPLTMALCAAIIALVADRSGLPRRGRPSLLGIAAIGVVGGLCGLRFVAHADDRLKAWTGLLSGPWGQPQAWLAWMGVVVWVALAAAVLLAVAGALSRRAAADKPAPPAWDVRAARLAFWASVSALVAVVVDIVRAAPWSSTTVDMMLAQGFAGGRWLATIVVVVPAICWPAVGATGALINGRRSRSVWALLGGAGVYGLAVHGWATVESLRAWPELSQQAAAALAQESAFGLDGWWATLEGSREASLEAVIVNGLLAGLAGALVIAARRQYGAWLTGRLGSVRDGAPERASHSLIGRGFAIAALLAVTLVVLAPAIADFLVTDGGALLGRGGLLSPSQAAAAAEPTATTPTLVPAEDGSLPDPAPRIAGVVPGGRFGDGAVEQWSGSLVQVNVESNGVDLDLAASTLTIDGDSVSAQPKVVALTPAMPTVSWTLMRRYDSGLHEFVVTLVASDGSRFTYAWDFDGGDH